MSTASSTSTRVFAIDPAHTSVGFSVRHLMIAKVRGTFGAVKGTIELPATGLIPSSIEAEIEIGSIDTREPQREAHLKSPDFFDADTHPTMKFKSTKIEAGDDKHFTVTGDLTIRGTTKSVSFKSEVTGTGTDPFGRGTRVAYEAQTRINRSDFGLTWNTALETGGVAVSDEVDITIDVQGIG
jgi:polyisoprenoid-binding protein YceI